MTYLNVFLTCASSGILSDWCDALTGDEIWKTKWEGIDMRQQWSWDRELRDLEPITESLFEMPEDQEIRHNKIYFRCNYAELDRKNSLHVLNVTPNKIVCLGYLQAGI